MLKNITITKEDIDTKKWMVEDGVKYAANESGILYCCGTGDHFFQPVSNHSFDYQFNEEFKSKYKSDELAPVICECGSNSFMLIYTGQYELSAKCTHCGIMEEVYSG